MGGTMSRNKGKRGEREVIKLLQPVVDEVYSACGQQPPLLLRNLMQSDRGGFDIVGLEWLALEVKFQETLALGAWWSQTLEQCCEGQVPMLFYRRSRVAWRVRLWAWLPPEDYSVRVLADIDVDSALVYIKRELEQRIK